MKKIITTEQIRDADQYTILHEPIASIDLMERASRKLFDWIRDHGLLSQPIYVFAGPGNNGGDGLALARMLAKVDTEIRVFLLESGSKMSVDASVNYSRLEQAGVPVSHICSSADFPEFKKSLVVVDALFGSGLKRPLEGLAASLVKYLNSSRQMMISVDMPSGLFGEDNRGNDPDAIIRANRTLSFQFPRLSFFFAENSIFTGDWQVLPIGLHEGFISRLHADYFCLTSEGVRTLLKPRKRFDHKGTYGHALLLAGSLGKIGAALLSGKACLRAGCGLLTTGLPQCGYEVMQAALPEAMCVVDVEKDCLTVLPDISGYVGIAIGPGVGMDARTGVVLEKLLRKAGKPIVLDADAINLISQRRELIPLIPGNSILTPHPGEFDRLTGKSSSGYERFLKQQAFSVENKLIVVLKGAFTSVSMPDGRVVFNTTGNPGMATAGSGDALTGIVLSLLTQGYSPEDASMLAVFLHGRAGDIALEKQSQESLLATDIINHLGFAFKELRA